MARPRQHSPEELHASVMAACDSWLKDHPIHALSLRSIARDVGCAASTLLKLYGSFNNLLQYVNLETLDSLKGHIDTFQAGTPDERLSALARAYWNFAHRYPHRWQLLFDYPLAEEGELDTRQGRMIEALFLRVEATLKEVQPQMADPEASRLARTLWGSVHGLVQLGLNQRLGYGQGQALEVTELLDQLLHTILAGLRAGGAGH